jgi:hypothetical protein
MNGGFQGSSSGSISISRLKVSMAVALRVARGQFAEESGISYKYYQAVEAAK